MQVVDLCALEDLAPSSMQRFDLLGHRLAVLRLEDQVHVIGDRCSHADVSLSEGLLDAESMTVECAKHGASFDLLTGQPQCLPATKPIPVYTVEVSQGRVMVHLEPIEG